MPRPHVQDGYTALMFAARRGHLEVTELLVKYGADKALQTPVGGAGRRVAFVWSVIVRAPISLFVWALHRLEMTPFAFE